jgi:hypothetical protein
MKSPSLSCLINVRLKSTLSGISIATPAYLGGCTVLVNLLPAFHPKPVFVSVNEMVLLQTKDSWIFLFNPFCKRCLLMGKLSPLTFSVNIDRYVVISAI